MIRHYAEIKSINLKHKSKIKGKENSDTEFYYEIELEDFFEESNDLKVELQINKVFDKTDNLNKKLLQQYLPALTTWDRVTKSIIKANAS